MVDVVVAKVLVDKLVVGDQVYVKVPVPPLPLAVITTLPLPHMAELVGVVEIVVVGEGLTVTLIVLPALVQPVVELVTVKVPL